MRGATWVGAGVAWMLVLAALLPGAQASWAPAPGDWPTFRGDAARTGASALKGIVDKPEGLWNFTSGAAVRSSPALADLDGDGRRDVVVGSSDGYLYALRDDGAQLWKFQTGVGSCGGPRQGVFGSPAIADLDADGKPEVVVTGADGVVYALRGASGERLWAHALPYEAAYNPYCTFYGGDMGSPAIADLDLDGRLDVVVPYGYYTLYIAYYSCGWGGCYPVFDWITAGGVRALRGEDGGLKWQQGLRYASGFHYPMPFGSPAIADLNNDGRPEVVWGNYEGSLFAVRSDGSLMWSTLTSYNAGPWLSSPAVGDVDGDNKAEIVVGTWGGQVLAFNHDGTPLWSFQAEGPVDAAPSLGDVDGDGALEVAAGSHDGKLYVLRGSDGQEAWRYAVTHDFRNWPIQGSVTLVDVDSNGKLDALFGADDGRLYAVHNDDGDALGNVRWTVQTKGAIASSPSVGDLTGDKKVEVLVGSNDGKLYAIKPKLLLLEPVLAPLEPILEPLGPATRPALQPAMGAVVDPNTDFFNGIAKQTNPYLEPLRPFSQYAADNAQAAVPVVQRAVPLLPRAEAGVTDSGAAAKLATSDVILDYDVPVTPGGTLLIAGQRVPVPPVRLRDEDLPQQVPRTVAGQQVVDAQVPLSLGSALPDARPPPVRLSEVLQAPGVPDRVAADVTTPGLVVEVGALCAGDVSVTLLGVPTEVAQGTCLPVDQRLEVVALPLARVDVPLPRVEPG